jgi:hypothetical protein
MRSAIFLALTFFGLVCVLPVHAQTNSGGWTATGSLNTNRDGQTATLLSNGLVLVAGGDDSGGNALANAELYNPGTGVFEATGNLNTPRFWHSATALPSGLVLVVGGFYVNGGSAVPASTAELYDPAAGTFTNTGSLVAAARFLSTATLLKSGKVLIAGGSDPNGNSLSSAELYDPATGAFTSTGSMNSQRQFHAATLLNNSKALVTGGYDSSGNVLSSAELYDPATGIFTTISAMNVTRFTHTSTLLNSGQVLIAGGYDLNFNTLASAELYDPVAGIFTLTGSLGAGRGSPTATLQNNGQVLIVGGADQGVNVADAELYDPITGTFVPTSNPATARYMQSATLLNNGAVLVAGGLSTNWSALSSAEIYTPPPSISNLSPTSAAAGARVTITGTNFGTTQGTVTFGGTAATIQSWTPGSISVQVPGSLVSGSVQVVVNTALGFSNGISFNVTSLTLSGLSLASAPIGALIELQGSGFGNAQQTSTVSFNGTSATSLSWGDGAILVSVPTGATTGNVVVQVRGALSNPLVFTVVAASFQPSISSTALPSPNPSNWNNSAVTVSYSCSAGGNVTNGGVPLTQNSCPPPQTVTTEAANQQITGTVTDGGGNSASVTTVLNIDKTPPTVIITSPTDGTSFTSSGVTISGTAADSLSGLAAVSCNGSVVPVTSGSFSCNISLNVGVNLVMVQAADVAGNVGASMLHLTLVSTLPAPTSLQISPANANVLAGATQQFTAVDQNGIPRKDATWTVDNSNIATISTDSSPVLTGLAAGTVTITASVGNISGQVQVHIVAGTSLPVGTIQWSAPQVAGFTVLRIVQAVPTSNGTPDLYSIEQDANLNVLVRAFTWDGQPLWQTLLPSGLAQSINQNSRAMGDALGGLIIATYQGILDLDGQSGSVAWQDPDMTSGSASIAPDGKILTSDGNGYLAKLDPQSGRPIFRYTPPPSIDNEQVGTCTNNAPVLSTTNSSITPNVAGASVVDSDGNAFFTISSYTRVGLLACVEGDPTQIGTSNYSHSLVKLYPDGMVSLTAVPVNGTVLAPDGNGGALVQWFTLQSGTPSASMMATSTGAMYPAPLGGLTGLVLGENGMAFGTDGLNVAVFAPLVGTVNGNYQSAQGVSSLSVEHTGGISLIDNQMNQTHLDANAKPSAPTLLSSNGSQIQPSLLNSWYGLVGPADSAPTTVASISNADFNWGDSSWAFASTFTLGSLTGGQGSLAMPYLALLPLAQLPSCQNVQIPCVNEQLENALSGLQSLLSQTCNACQGHVFGISQLNLSQTSFYNYLNQGHKFYDATRSTAKAGEVVCTPSTFLHPFPPQCGLSPGQFDTPLKVLWQEDDFAAISKTPSPQGAVIAFDPAQVCGSASATVAVCKTLSTTQALQYEEGVLFHENLHGTTGMFDNPLEGVFGICSGQPPLAISEYLNFWVFGLGAAPTTPQPGTCTRWP